MTRALFNFFVRLADAFGVRPGRMGSRRTHPAHWLTTMAAA